MGNTKTLILCIGNSARSRMAKANSGSGPETGLRRDVPVSTPSELARVRSEGSRKSVSRSAIRPPGCSLSSGKTEFGSLVAVCARAEE